MATITSEVSRINTRKSEIAEALISRFGVQRTDYLSASGATNTKKGLYDSQGAIKNLDYWVEALNGTVVVADLLGTSTVGSGTNPIYLNNGAPTASNSTVGNAEQPVYLKNGVLTACSGYIYSDDLEIQINSGGDEGDTYFLYPGNGSVVIDFVQDAGISLIGSGGAVNVKNTAPVYFINGTQTASTNAWTGDLPPNVTAYYNGLSIRYRLPYAGTSTAATLKLGNLTACPVKRSSSSIGNATTHYAAGSILGLTYYGGNWYTDGDYDSTDTNRLKPYYARYYNGAIALGGNQIVALDRDGRLTPLTTTQGTATNKAAITTPFRPESLMYYWSESGVAANAVTTHATLYNQAYISGKTNTTFNASVPAYNSVYLVGTYSAVTGMFTLDNTSTTSWYKFVPANAAIESLSTYFTAGKHYIYLGHSYKDANYMALNLENPVYVFDGGALIPVIAQTMGLQPVLCNTLDVSANYFYTDYAGGGNAVTTKPSGVDAFGCIHLRTAAGYYGEILMSSNQSTGVYYRNASTLNSSASWNKFLDSSNLGFSNSGSNRAVVQNSAGKLYVSQIETCLRTQSSGAGTALTTSGGSGTVYVQTTFDGTKEALATAKAIQTAYGSPDDYFKYRGELATSYVDLTATTANHANYVNVASGTYKVPRTGHSELLIAFTGEGSTSGVDILTKYTYGSPLKYRHRIDSNRIDGGWRTLLDSYNTSVEEEYLELADGNEIEAYVLRCPISQELGTEGSPITYSAGTYSIYATSLPTNITTNYYLLGAKGTQDGMKSPVFSPNIYTRAGKGDLYLKNIQSTSGTTATVLQAMNSNSKDIFKITHRYSSSTETTEGLTLLTLGNSYGDKYAYNTYEGTSKPTATTGNARGELRLYNRGAAYESIYADYNRDFVGTMASLTIKSANGSNAVFLEDSYCNSWFASIYGGNTNNAKLSLRQYSDTTHVAEQLTISTGDLGNAIISYSSTGTPGSGTLNCLNASGSGVVRVTTGASGWPTQNAPVVVQANNNRLLFRFTINVTIPEGYALHNFKIYPNSAAGAITLNPNSTGTLTWRLYTAVNDNTSVSRTETFSATKDTNYSQFFQIPPGTGDSGLVLTTSGTYEVLTYLVNNSNFNITTYMDLYSGSNYSYSYSLRPYGSRKIRTIDSTGVKIYTQNDNSFSGLSATTSAFYYDAGASGIMIKSGGVYIKNNSSWYKLNISGSTVSATAVTSI